VRKPGTLLHWLTVILMSVDNPAAAGYIMQQQQWPAETGQDRPAGDGHQVQIRTWLPAQQPIQQLAEGLACSPAAAGSSFAGLGSHCVLASGRYALIQQQQGASDSAALSLVNRAEHGARMRHVTTYMRVLALLGSARTTRSCWPWRVFQLVLLTETVAVQCTSFLGCQ
jgi:hypothetical protein